MAQRVTAEAPLQTTRPTPDRTSPAKPVDRPHTDAADLPEGPAGDRYPIAVPVPDAAERKVTLDSNRQTRNGDQVLLEGDVHLQYGDYAVDADHIAYNEATGEVEANGHVYIQGAKATESIHAIRATLNIKTETGRFYDVSGSIGVRSTTRGNVYTTDNPFLFTGRMVVKSGPDQIDIYDGTVTSCQLPKPDWELASRHFSVSNGKARASKTTFRLLNFPVLFLPYVTHPTGAGERQAGFLIPVIGNSSTKGLVLGEQIYMPISRSAELIVGAEYFSSRGWQQSATFRMHGNGMNFVNAHYSGLLDRGYHQTTYDANNQPTVTYINQGGEDVTFSGRKDFSEHTRAAANVEYLSSYIYREAFTDNFNQAVSSDITSYAYATHARNGYVAAFEADRYQGLKIVSTGDQIRIFHAPQLQGEMLEKRLGTTPFVWSATTQYTALKRTQGTPLAQTGFASNFVSRIDVHPKLSLPFAFGGFHFRPAVGLRDTWYQHSRAATNLPGPPPTEQAAGLNRLVKEADFELRAPVLERVFDTGFLSKFLGRQAKHTIEPMLHYRYASGVDDFSRTLRFDDTDVVSNKNELEYGFVQRLFMRPTKTRDCETGETPSEIDSTCGGTRETLRWKLVQRAYFDPGFGGVIVNGRRNVLDTTLDLSGVAFLTDKRAASPIVSEMKLSATDHFDLEWDMNYDTHAGKFTQSNTFLDFHDGKVFGGLSHARLNAPGRFSTGTGTGNTTVTSGTSDFSQLRLLLGYGTPTKPGLSIAGNVGLDLSAVRPQSTATNVMRGIQTQYAAAQFAYNWNCCGFSVEYRKYELGSVRNENAYRFNFSLANIGTAGNIRRAERLF
ncbi:MAG: LPS-assembly protein LptD [Janthinobacterium lividum]